MQMNHRIHSIFKASFVAFFCLALLLSGGVAKSYARDFIRWGGSNPGGVYFVIGGGLSQLFNDKIEGVNVSNVQSAGSVGNNRLARKGEVEMWFGYSFTALENYTGTGAFKGQDSFKDIRVVSGVYSGLYHIVVLAKSEFKTVADLEGAKVCMGGPGSGAAANSEYVLGALGMWDKIDRQQWSYSACGRGMLDGQTDAFTSPMAPMPVVVTTGSMKPIKYIPLSDEEMDKVIEQYPFYSKSVIKGGVYKTLNEDSPALAYQVLWFAHKDVKPELIYQMLKTTYDPKNEKKVHAIHKVMNQMSSKIEEMTPLGVPYHAGAVKYWKEQGQVVPDTLVPPEMGK